MMLGMKVIILFIYDMNEFKVAIVRLRGVIARKRLGALRSTIAFISAVRHRELVVAADSDSAATTAVPSGGRRSILG